MSIIQPSGPTVYVPLLTCNIHTNILHLKAIILLGPLTSPNHQQHLDTRHEAETMSSLYFPVEQQLNDKAPISYKEMVTHQNILTSSIT